MKRLESWPRATPSGAAATPPPLPPIPTVTTIDEVVEAIESIIDWSISVSSRMGYFAALYKRITIAIGKLHLIRKGPLEWEGLFSCSFCYACLSSEE